MGARGPSGSWTGVPGPQPEPLPARLPPGHLPIPLQGFCDLGGFVPAAAPRLGLHLPPRSSFPHPPHPPPTPLLFLCPLLNTQLLSLENIKEVLAMPVVLPALVLLVLSPPWAPKHSVTHRSQGSIRCGFRNTCAPFQALTSASPYHHPCLRSWLAGAGKPSARSCRLLPYRSALQRASCLLSTAQAPSRSPDPPHKCWGALTLHRRP